jgi:hypothetical protein
MLGGKRGDGCDIVANLYERDLTYEKYRGLKNQFLSSVTYVFQLSTLGLGLQAAQLSIVSDQPERWKTA